MFFLVAFLYSWRLISRSQCHQLGNLEARDSWQRQSYPYCERSQIPVELISLEGNMTSHGLLLVFFVCKNPPDPPKFLPGAPDYSIPFFLFLFSFLPSSRFQVFQLMSSYSIASIYRAILFKFYGLFDSMPSTINHQVNVKFVSCEVNDILQSESLTWGTCKAFSLLFLTYKEKLF